MNSKSNGLILWIFMIIFLFPSFSFFASFPSFPSFPIFSHLFPSFPIFSHLFPSFLRINSFFKKKKNRVGSTIVLELELELELPKVLTLPTPFMTQWNDWSADRFSFPFFPSFPSLFSSILSFQLQDEANFNRWMEKQGGERAMMKYCKEGREEGRKENQNCCRESEFTWEIAWESRWEKRNCPIIHTFPLQFNPISWNFQARTTANFFFVFGNQVCFLLLSISFPFPFLSPSKIKKPQSQSPPRYYYEITQYARFLHLLIPTMTPFPSQIHATRLIRIRFSDLDAISRLAGEGRKCPHYFGFWWRKVIIWPLWFPILFVSFCFVFFSSLLFSSLSFSSFLLFPSLSFFSSSSSIIRTFVFEIQ